MIEVATVFHCAEFVHENFVFAEKLLSQRNDGERTVRNHSFYLRIRR